MLMDFISNMLFNFKKFFVTKMVLCLEKPFNMLAVLMIPNCAKFEFLFEPDYPSILFNIAFP